MVYAMLFFNITVFSTQYIMWNIKYNGYIYIYTYTHSTKKQQNKIWVYWVAVRRRWCWETEQRQGIRSNP